MRLLIAPLLLTAAAGLLCFTGCTGDSPVVADEDTPTEVPVHEDQSSSAGSGAASTAEAVSSDVPGSDPVPAPQPPAIPDVVKNAPTTKVVMHFPDKTPMKEFFAKTLEDDQYVPHGSYVEYYPGGAKHSEGEYEYGRKVGTWTFFGKDGIVRKKGAYVQDRQDGEWRKYRKDGTLDWIERYQDGQAHGVWTAYREDGVTVAWERGYKHGKRDGVWTDFYPDGTRRSIETYKVGNFDGPAKRWFENGALNMEGAYVAGKRHGTFRVFGKDGLLRDEVDWENGELKMQLRP